MAGTFSIYSELGFSSGATFGKDVLARPTITFDIPDNTQINQINRTLLENNSDQGNTDSILRIDNAKIFYYIQTNIPVRLIIENERSGTDMILNRFAFVMAPARIIRVINTATDKKASLRAIYA